ncbi:MAG: AAA family ATPase [Legionellales bacterium]|nr:AAA family ATPase [Legionellales bacterium]
MDSIFIGRQAELKDLQQLNRRKVANLVIIQGRRRIGKSRLIAEFAKGQTFYCFTGMAPSPDTTPQMQLDEFARQYAEQFHLPRFLMNDWGDLFTLLYKSVANDKVVILFDEISWMGSLDPTFLAKLKNAWDTQFKKNPKLMLVLCGSVSSWIEKNIISSTLFLGRPSLYMKLNELSLPECNEFWKGVKHKVTAYEKFKLLAVTGGVPRYLELIDPHLTAEENIRHLCFTPNAPLVDEFERIFSDIFGNRSEMYKKIIQRLVIGQATLDEILASCGREKTGDFSEYLNDLELAGFVARDFTWHLKNGKQSKLSHYRLKDNYVRFYLKYLEPNKAKINKGLFRKQSVTSLPAWESIMGLQFQNLILNNDLGIIQKLAIPFEDVVFVNPFFQRKTKQQAGCQIDLLIQTKFNCAFVCEIKFHKSELNTSIINEVDEKIKKLKLPKNFSYRPVLIHVNGIRDALKEEGYFSNIIDFGEILLGN